MKVMVPHGNARDARGRCIRTMRFAARSWIGTQTACAVATNVGAQLAHVCSRSVPTRVLPPVVPDSASWNSLLREARLVHVRGSAARAALVVREADALQLVCAALGEEPSAPRALSAIERRILGEILVGLTGALAPLCGPDAQCAPAADEFFTYFEVLAGARAPVRIGVAAGNPVSASPGHTVRPHHLAGVELEMNVEVACGELPAARVLDLRPGDVVPMTTKIGEPGILRLAGVEIARGTCGTAGTRFAMMVL